MNQFFQIAAATATVALISMSAGTVLAQTPSNSGTAPSAATAAPAATSTPATTAPADTSTTTATEKAAPKKKKPARMTRQQEIDRSVDSGTVPARYRSSVPKEYHQYIPFAK